jgi:hypothetical protein
MIIDYQSKQGRLYGSPVGIQWPNLDATISFRDILYFIAGAVLVYAFIDFAVFVLWIYSGQLPVDDQYLGAMTSHIINYFIN